MSELPPLLGLPHEQICRPSWCVPFYTCVIGPFRINVYTSGGWANGWLVERKINDVNKKADQQFFEIGTVPLCQMNCYDPIALLGVIQDLTSESNSDASPTGATDSVLPLQI